MKRRYEMFVLSGTDVISIRVHSENDVTGLGSIAAIAGSILLTYRPFVGFVAVFCDLPFRLRFGSAPRAGGPRARLRASVESLVTADFGFESRHCFNLTDLEI